MRVPLLALGIVLRASTVGAADLERGTMAEAHLDSGKCLLALNELSIGHRRHQSVRYVTEAISMRERQSSSVLIVTSGTGVTGWTCSIVESTANPLKLTPEHRAIGFFPCEPFSSVSAGTALRSGKLIDQPLRIMLQMNEGSVIFTDGIEQDFLMFNRGRQ